MLSYRPKSTRSPLRDTALPKTFKKAQPPESSCERKETVDIGILVTSRNGEKKSCNLSE